MGGGRERERERERERDEEEEKEEEDGMVWRKIKRKTKTSLRKRHWEATGNGMDKNSKGQRKLEDSGGRLTSCG